MSQHRSVRGRISALLGAAVVAMAVGGPAAAQADDDINFLPQASLSVDAPNQLVGGFAKLQASASFINIGSSASYLKIYDVTAQKFLTHCKSNTCNWSVSQNVVTQHTYRAYIAGQATTFPPPSIKAASNDVVVRWGAKLVLNADKTALFDREVANLTAKAAFAGPIVIRDATTGQMVKNCVVPTTVCSSPVKNFPSTHKYYATQGALTSNTVGITWMKIPT